MSWFITLVFTIVGIWFFLFAMEAFTVARARKATQAGTAAALGRRTANAISLWEQRARIAHSRSALSSVSLRYKQEIKLRAELMTAGLLSEDASSISREVVRKLWASLGPARHW